MALRKKKGYKFSDEMLVSDTIISLIMGGLALIFLIFAIIYSVVKKGSIPDSFGSLVLACAVMAVTAFIFGLLSYKNQDGGILTKRTSVIISIIDMVLIVLLYIF